MSNELTFTGAIERYPSIHHLGQVKEILRRLETAEILNQKNLQLLASQADDFTGQVQDDWKFSAVRPVTFLLLQLGLLNQANFEIIANETNAERFYYTRQNLKNELRTAGNIQKLLNINHETDSLKPLHGLIGASWFQQNDFNELMAITPEHRSELKKALESDTGLDRDKYETIKKTIFFLAQNDFMKNVMTLCVGVGLTEKKGTESILPESIVHLIAVYAKTNSRYLPEVQRSALVTSAYNATRQLLKDNIKLLSDKNKNAGAGDKILLNKHCFV